MLILLLSFLALSFAIPNTSKQIKLQPAELLETKQALSSQIKNGAIVHFECSGNICPGGWESGGYNRDPPPAPQYLQFQNCDGVSGVPNWDSIPSDYSHWKLSLVSSSSSNDCIKYDSEVIIQLTWTSLNLLCQPKFTLRHPTDPSASGKCITYEDVVYLSATQGSTTLFLSPQYGFPTQNDYLLQYSNPFTLTSVQTVTHPIFNKMPPHPVRSQFKIIPYGWEKQSLFLGDKVNLQCTGSACPGGKYDLDNPNAQIIPSPQLLTFLGNDNVCDQIGGIQIAQANSQKSSWEIKNPRPRGYKDCVRWGDQLSFEINNVRLLCTWFYLYHPSDPNKSGKCVRYDDASAFFGVLTIYIQGVDYLIPSDSNPSTTRIYEYANPFIKSNSVGVSINNALKSNIQIILGSRASSPPPPAPPPPPPPPSSPGVCPRSGTWCTHAGSQYKNVDCDGDGLLDHACSDNTGARGRIASASGCVDNWGGAPISSCPAAFGSNPAPPPPPPTSWPDCQPGFTFTAAGGCTQDIFICAAATNNIMTSDRRGCEACPAGTQRTSPITCVTISGGGGGGGSMPGCSWNDGSRFYDLSFLSTSQGVSGGANYQFSICQNVVPPVTTCPPNQVGYQYAGSMCFGLGQLNTVQHYYINNANNPSVIGHRLIYTGGSYEPNLGYREIHIDILPCSSSNYASFINENPTLTYNFVWATTGGCV